MLHQPITADETASWPQNVTRQTSATDFMRLMNREALRLENSVRRPRVVERMLIDGSL